jgi:hypothetical protein
MEVETLRVKLEALETKAGLLEVQRDHERTSPEERIAIRIEIASMRNEIASIRNEIASMRNGIQQGQGMFCCSSPIHGIFI